MSAFARFWGLRTAPQSMNSAQCPAFQSLFLDLVFFEFLATSSCYKMHANCLLIKKVNIKMKTSIILIFCKYGGD